MSIFKYIYSKIIEYYIANNFFADEGVEALGQNLPSIPLLLELDLGNYIYIYIYKYIYIYILYIWDIYSCYRVQWNWKSWNSKSDNYLFSFFAQLNSLIL